MFFDTHAHLESPRFTADLPEVVARAESAGVTRILTCGSDLQTSGEAIALCQSYAGLHGAVGVHGHQALSAIRANPAAEAGYELDEDVFADLAELAHQPGVVALGEIGLDYHYDFSPREVQCAVLARQLTLAAKLDLPIILHNRESDTDLRRVVEAAPPSLRGVLHCFLADQEMAEWAVGRGFYLGVAGPITFKNAGPLAKILSKVPLERLLIETDCPYLAPHPKRGQRNEPSFVRYVATGLADVLGISVDALARRTMENGCRLLRID